MTTTTLEQELDGLLTWLSRRRSRYTGRAIAESTAMSKRSRLRTCCTAAGVSSLEGLAAYLQNRDLVEELLDKLHEGRTNGGVIAYVAALFDLAAYAEHKQWVPGPSALVKADYPAPNPQKPITVYTQDEVDLMLSAARGRSLRFWAMLTTIAETGRRVGEVLGLRWEWLHLATEVPHFALPTSKNGKQQYVPLTKVLREQVYTPEHIALLKADTDRPGNKQFTRSVDEFPFPYTYQGALQVLRHHCEQLGVECRAFHNFRHTKATDLLTKGVPIQAVAALLGHASVQTTDRIYNHATALSFAHYND